MNNRIWTEEEIKYLKENYAKLSAKEIAKNLKRTKNAIKTKVMKLKINKRIWTAAEIKYIKENYSLLKPVKIANKLNRSLGGIINIANKLGLENYKDWSDEELDFLKENYSKYTNEELSKIIKGKTIWLIKQCARKLKLKRDLFWTEEEINYLKENYSKYTNEELSKMMKNRSSGSIGSKAKILNLEKDTFWTEVEINYLKENYHNLNIKIENIAKKLNRSISSIIHKANLFLLKRDIKYNCHPKDMTNEQLHSIAFQHKRRIDFITNDSTYVEEARKRGIFDEICEHMIDNSSLPQRILQKITETILNQKGLYNTRKIIKPYELDIYFEKFNLAFEYDGLYYHEERKDADLYKEILCKNKGITLIRIYEYVGRTTFEHYILDIKNQLIENLILINNISKLNIKKENIDIEINKYELLQNKEDIKTICDNYTILKNFRIEQNKLYDFLKSNKFLKEFTSHMIRKGKLN